MPRKLVHSIAIVDHRGVLASPGALLLDGETIVAAGTPQEIGRPVDARFTQFDKIVTPSFVNTHTHLDLSGVGTAPTRDSFCSWVEEVVLPIRRDEASVQSSVLRGIELVYKGCSSIIGDISGTREAAEIVQESKLIALTFLELIGTGTRQDECIDLIRQLPKEYGVQPHAPYSCGLDVFQEAFSSGRPIALHLAETRQEVEFAKCRTGEMVDFVRRMGAWDEAEEAWGGHPVDIILEIAKSTSCIAAHLNYIEDTHLQRLAASNMTVAYCPRASDYFGHRGHRWQEMLEVGINVALGTDSLLCLDTQDRISILDEMRYLYARDHVDPMLLMAMGTINGAKGLGVDPDLVTLNAGKTAGLLAFDSISCDPISDIFSGSAMPSWLAADLIRN